LNVNSPAKVNKQGAYMTKQRKLWSFGMRGCLERANRRPHAIILAAALCAAATTPAASQDLLDDLIKSILPAQTFEQARIKTKQGYGAKVHGKITINGKSFNFVSGGRGRGSAPFGTYDVGSLSGFKAPKGSWVPGYPLSDAYDPYVNDTRTGLFIHPGHDASSGCLAVRKDEWPSFVKAMKDAAKDGGSPAVVRLGPGSEPMQEEPSRPIVQRVAHKRSWARRSGATKIHLRSHGRAHHYSNA
jgi:hypothetical protein